MKTDKGRFGTEASALGPVLARFAQRMQEAGYAATMVQVHLRICRRFASYLAQQGIALGCLRDKHVGDFLDAATADPKLRDGGRRRRHEWRRPVAQLVEQLRAEGLVPQAKRTALGPCLADYLAFLREHRGIGAATLTRQSRDVGQFLTAIEACSEDDLRRITIEQVDRHLVQASRRLARHSIGLLSSSLRGFLGYLHMRGILPQDLRPHVVTPLVYPLEEMPRAAAWSDIQRTLALIDRSTLLGCRDYAMFTLIACCGLRACDVAALRLQDLDWRHDVIHARRSKGGTREDVPLLPVVGEALIAYLRQRPAFPHDEVFLTVRAPVRPVLRTHISARARLQLMRAGVKAGTLGAHTLRHSFAVELQRQGRSLKEIGEVLGHSHPGSTFIYAKANVERLREAALDIDQVLP